VPGDIRSKIFRRRSESLGPRWEYELPEGKIATPAQLPEYRRRCRRIALYQCAIIFGFIPLAAWLDIAFLSDAIIQFLAFIASAMAAGLLMMCAARTFRCPVCDCQFKVGSKYGPRLSQLSAVRREALFGRFRWCDCCGTRFEIYPPSVAIPWAKEDDRFGIL
jgi:hypothetical protein